MNTYEQAGARLDPQEELLVALKHGEHTAVLDRITDGFAEGRSPNFLSFASYDLVAAFAHAAVGELSDASNASEPASGDVRPGLFDRFASEAYGGEPAAIYALPKFATSPGQLATALGLVLDYRESVAEWRAGRPQIQLIGSFNPQHIGHRATMSAALEAGGANASLSAQVVANHPVKKDSLPPYERRYGAAEQHLYRSSFIDPTRVTLLDVPVGPGLSKAGAAQIELLADVAGDPQMRWLVGSDKFMSDVATARGDDRSKRAVIRFAEPRMHLYVARRATHDRDELEAAIAFIEDTFGTAMTLVDTAPSDLVLGASASLIRQLRSEGRDQEADRIQFADLAPVNV